MCEDRSVPIGIFVWCVVFFFFSDTVRSLFKGRVRFGEGLLGENYNRIAARGRGGGVAGLSPRSALQRPLRLRA